MSMSITSLTKPPGDPLFYEPNFRTLIETHLFILRSDSIVLKKPIGGDKLHQFEGDFYGLLAELNVPPEHFWIFLRVNDLLNPADFGKETYNEYRHDYQFILKIPSDDYINQLVLLYKTTRR